MEILRFHKFSVMAPGTIGASDPAYYIYDMPALNLIEETISHFQEGARSVRAHTSEVTYIITKEKDAEGFWVTTEEPGFTKTKTNSLDKYYQDVFGIEARY